MKRFFLVVFCFALVACSGSKQVTKSETTKEVFREHKISFKDTLFNIPASKAELSIPLVDLQRPHLEPRDYEQKHGNATAKLRIEKDTVFVSAECDSITLAAQIRQELITEYEKETTDTEIKEKKGVTVFKLILYMILSFITGLVAGVLVKTFLI